MPIKHPFNRDISVTTPTQPRGNTRVYRGETPSEASEQKAFVEWLRLKHVLFTASANGERRLPQDGRKLKLMGVSAGYPDITICEPRGCWHGCMLEFKPLKGGKLSALQEAWLDQLSERGYYARMVRGCTEAIEVTEYYLSQGTQGL